MINIGDKIDFVKKKQPFLTRNAKVAVSEVFIDQVDF